MSTQTKFKDAHVMSEGAQSHDHYMGEQARCKPTDSCWCLLSTFAIQITPQINYTYVNKVVKAAIHLLMVNMNGVYLVFSYLGIGTYYPVNIQSTIITHFPHWILFICIMYISPYASQLREPERRRSCCRCRRTSPLCWSSCRALLRLRTPWPGADGSASPPPHTDGWY